MFPCRTGLAYGLADRFLDFLSIPTLYLVSSKPIRPMMNSFGFAINETPNPGEAISLNVPASHFGT